MKTILAPIDFSEDSLLALRMADFAASVLKARLIVLYVETCDTIVVPVVADPFDPCRRQLRFTPIDNVAVARTRGRPADEILRSVRRFRADAIFMGHGSHSTRPGRVADAVRRRFSGPMKLFSEKMAGRLTA